MSRTLLVTAMKDEGPSLLEWIAHARVIGFDDILVYQNDSSDFTGVMLERLEALGLIHYRDISGRTGKPQINATGDAFKSELYARTDWCFFIDCDEFFVPHGANTVAEFLARYKEAEAIAVNWLNFGSGGEEQWRPGLAIDRFKRCAARQSGPNAGFKTFHRTDAGFTGFGVHRPWSDVSRKGYIYPDGEMVPEALQTGDVPHMMDAPPVHLDGAQLNHYSAKSRQEFERKLVRGSGYRPNIKLLPERFAWFDTNADSNTEISRFRDAIAAETARLLEDPMLAWLNHRSLVHHFGEAAEQA